MQDILDMDILAQIRLKQEQKRDVFLANINPTRDGTCHWDGCNERATTQCQLGKLDNVRTCRFCWHHYAETRDFVINLARYEMPESGA